MDALAREFAATHDMKVKEEIERLASFCRETVCSSPVSRGPLLKSQHFFDVEELEPKKS
jgi:hypothetical protein